MSMNLNRQKMTKKRYNPKGIENHRRNYHMNNDLFVENESESLTGFHMGYQVNKFLFFLVQTCTFIVLASTWQNSDKEHATSTFSESWVNRGSLNGLGVRSGRLLIGDAHISIGPHYELYDEREANLLGENYHSSKKHLHGILLDNNFTKHLNDSIYNNRCVREANMQANENANNRRVIPRESFDSLSFDNDLNQSNGSPNDQNQFGMSFDDMQHHNNVEEDIDHEQLDESFVNHLDHPENDGRNSNNRGPNPDYNSMMNDKESSGSTEFGETAISSSPGAGDNISSKGLEPLKQCNNFKENGDEAQLDEYFEMNNSSVQFDGRTSKTLNNFKSSDNVNKNVPGEKMKGSNSSRSKQCEVSSVNVTFDESHYTLREYSDFQDKVNDIKMDDDFKEGLFSLKEVSNVNLSLGKIEGDINRNQGFNRNNDVLSAANCEHNYEALSNNEHSDRKSDALKNYNDSKGKLNAEALHSDFENEVNGRMGHNFPPNDANFLKGDVGVNIRFDKFSDAEEKNKKFYPLRAVDNVHKIFDQRSDGEGITNDQYGPFKDADDMSHVEGFSDDEHNTTKLFGPLNDNNDMKNQFRPLKDGRRKAIHNEKYDLHEENEQICAEMYDQEYNTNGCDKSKDEDDSNEHYNNFKNDEDSQVSLCNPFKKSKSVKNVEHGAQVSAINLESLFEVNKDTLNEHGLDGSLEQYNPLKGQVNGEELHDSLENGVNRLREHDLPKNGVHPSECGPQNGNEKSENINGRNNTNRGFERSKNEDDEYETAEGRYKRYDENNIRDYDTQGGYRSDHNCVNVLKQDEIASESQELGKYGYCTEVVTTVIEDIGNDKEQFDEALRDVNARKPSDITPEDNTNVSEHFDGTLKDNAGVQEQLNEAKNYQDNKQSGKSKDEEQVNITYEKLDGGRINSKSQKSEYDDKGSYVTYKSTAINDTYNSAIHISKEANDQRCDMTKKLKSIDDINSDIHDHSKYGDKIGDRKGGRNGDKNDHKTDGQNSFITRNSQNDENTCTISDESMADRNKNNSHIFKKDNANYKRKATELINTNNYQNELLNAKELTDHFKIMFNILENAVATERRFEALKYYERFKKEILNIQLEGDLMDGVNEVELRIHTKKSLCAAKKEYDDSCDSSEDENYSDRQSYILGHNNRDKKELNKKKEGMYYVDTRPIRDNYDSKSQYNVLKGKNSSRNSFDKLNIGTDYYNSRGSFDVSKDNNLVKEASDKSKDGTVYCGSKKSLGVREGSYIEKKILVKNKNHNYYYYASNQSSVSSKVSSDMAKKSYNKSRDTTDKCETRSLYSILSRSKSRKSLDKSGGASDYCGSKGACNGSKDNKVIKNISHQPNKLCNSAKASTLLMDADSSSMKGVNKINNKEKGKGNDKVNSCSVKSSYSLKEKTKDKKNSSNPLKHDQSNLDDLYDELDDAYYMNKRLEALQYIKEHFYKQHDDLKYDEKEFDTIYKAVQRYEEIDKKNPNRSGDNDNNSVKSHEESEKGNDSLKTTDTFKRRSIGCEKWDLLKRNDIPMEMEESFRHSEQNFLHPDEFRHDRNYKDSNGKATNNRRNDNGKNHNRRYDIDYDYEKCLGNSKSNKKSFIKRVFSYIKGDENEPSTSRMFNKKSLFSKTLKLIKKIDFKFELEMMTSIKSSIKTDKFWIQRPTCFNKLFYYTKKYKIFFPILLMLLASIILHIVSLTNVALGINLVLLGMMFYYHMKLLKCRKMGKVFRTFSEKNKFEIN
ncbi:hypothetical protein C922_05352 [Plasmodium inui San Antonio 1]|uniref:Pv-fam-d protein n=1 Tax=Plasmodium inui San Antonio 1 TaxID=1237626 RepID=W6ZY99_9APIC|nr:hypothetical protein C922_05352 [Plasmodium inui San Antonio 1]EUD64265.1 hypothetical protein C922_05352 [Plasmodium inui San Antonio 1]